MHGWLIVLLMLSGSPESDALYRLGCWPSGDVVEFNSGVPSLRALCVAQQRATGVSLSKASAWKAWNRQLSRSGHEAIWVKDGSHPRSPHSLTHL
jgi:hypothetical protein